MSVCVLLCRSLHSTLSLTLCATSVRNKVGLPGDVMGSPMSIPSEKEDGDWVEGAAADFDFVRFTVSDINGVPRSKLIPRRHVIKVKVRLPPHLYSITTLPSKTHTTANIDATFSNV